MRLPKFSPRFWIALVIFAIIFLFGFIGPFLFPGHTPTKVAGGLYDPPSGAAWLGTDHIGQDVFGQLIYGTRTSLIVGLLGGAVAVVVGVLIGTLAGYIGGWVEEALMAFTNVIVAIPQIVVLILISIALNSRSAVGVPWSSR
jgi:peptide/nickel transport system permease protein